MEYANQEILDIGCENKKEYKKRTSFIKKHKVMSFIIATTIVLIGINSFMIHEFFRIISTL